MGEKSELIEALAKATLEFKSINKNGKAKVRTKSGSEYSYEYATLDDIINATSEALSNNGLTLSHKTQEFNGETWLVSKLRHKSGCPSDKTKSKIDKYVNEGYMSAVQAYGSIITYLKRYHIGMLLNIAIDEDDDGKDSNGKTGQKQKPQENEKEQPPQNPPENELKTVADYEKRIKECKNIFEIKSWGEKHADEIKKLGKQDADKIRTIFALTKDILQKDHDVEKLSQLTKKAKDVVKAYLDEGDLWGDDVMARALRGNPDAITAFDKELDDYIADKQVDLLGNGESEHNPPA